MQYRIIGQTVPVVEMKLFFQIYLFIIQVKSHHSLILS